MTGSIPSILDEATLFIAVVFIERAIHPAPLTAAESEAF